MKNKDWEKEYEELFEQAVRNCLRQVKGEITEEQRVRENDILNSKGLEIIKNQIKQAKIEAVREFVRHLEEDGKLRIEQQIYIFKEIGRYIANLGGKNDS